jgi:hypothetical protein
MFILATSTEQSFSRETCDRSAHQEIRNEWNPKIHYRGHRFLVSVMNPVHIPTSCFSKIVLWVSQVMFLQVFGLECCTWGLFLVSPTRDKCSFHSFSMFALFLFCKFKAIQKGT